MKTNISTTREQSDRLLKCGVPAESADMIGVDPDNDCICYGVVEFDKGYLAWVINIFKCEYPMTEFIEEGGSETLLNLFGHEYGYDNCNLKVLGNRFDTPDLLNGK